MAGRGTREESYGSEGYGYEDRLGARSPSNQRGFGAIQDDHYLVWRDRQIAQFDRDYEDYRRERSQQHHDDFQSWRRSRQRSDGVDAGGADSGDVGVTRGASGSIAEKADRPARGQERR